jgi:hypothetical protein
VGSHAHEEFAGDLGPKGRETIADGMARSPLGDAASEGPLAWTRAGVVPDRSVLGGLGKLLPTDPIHWHSNAWECREIAQIFVEMGYTVDAISAANRSFRPAADYAALAADPGPSAALPLLTIAPLLLVVSPCGWARLDRDPLTLSRRRALVDRLGLEDAAQ